MKYRVIFSREDLTKEDAAQLILAGVPYRLDTCTSSKSCELCDGEGIMFFEERYT